MVVGGWTERIGPKEVRLVSWVVGLRLCGCGSTMGDEGDDAGSRLDEGRQVGSWCEVVVTGEGWPPGVIQSG